MWNFFFRRNEENLIAAEDEDGNNNDEDKIGESQLGQEVKDDDEEEEEKDLDVEKMKSQGKKKFSKSKNGLKQINYFNLPYIPGVSRLFCLRANIQQINSTAGRKENFFSLFTSC